MVRVDLYGLPVDSIEQASTVLDMLTTHLDQQRPCLLSFVNPAAWAIARREAGYAELLRSFDLVLPDGIGVAHVLRRLGNPGTGRFSFDASSLYPPLFARLDARRASIFVAGAGPGIAARAVERMRQDFPQVDYRGHSDGYRDHEELRAMIMAAAPKVVLCGMGVPRQERFLMSLKAAGYEGLMITCGGFLDQLAQARHYYPGWIDRLELRWAWRLYREPGRLWRRYAIDYWPFIRASLPDLCRSTLSGARPGRPVERTGLP